MVDEKLLNKLREHVSYFPRKEQAIILCLHEIQNYYGYVPQESLEYLSKLLEVPLSHLDNVVAFYDMFDRGEKAKHRIRVCVSIVCDLVNNQPLIKALRETLGIGFGEVTKDGRFKLIPVQCLGACAVAPMFMVDDDTYKFESKEQLNEILSRYT